MNYGPFARFRILVVAFACCNSQSETLIFGNEPIRLRESYRQRLRFMSRSWSRSEETTFSFGVDIVVKNKSSVHGLTLSVLLSRTSTRHHSSQNVMDSRGAADVRARAL